MSDGRQRALFEKLVAEAQAALDAGDRDQGRELAWKALDCGEDAAETTGLRQLLEALEGPFEVVGRDGIGAVEPTQKECEKASGTASPSVEPEWRSAATGEPLSSDEAAAFEAFLERGGAAGLEAELASENDSASESPTPTRRQGHDEDDGYDQEELRRERTNNRAKLVFGSLAGCVVLATGWVVVNAVAETKPPRSECASLERPAAIAMPFLGGSGGVTPRNVPTTEIERVLAEQRIIEARLEASSDSSSRRDPESAARQQTVAGGGLSGGGPGGLAQSAQSSERVGSMMPAGGTDATPVFAPPRASNGSGPSPQEGRRPSYAGRRVSRPDRESPRASSRRGSGGGRFFATDMTSQVKSVQVAKKTPRLRLPVGREVKAVLDLGITSLRHGEVLARVEQTVTVGNASLPRGSMLVGSSENDRKRIYVTFTKAVVDGKPLALRAMAIEGKMPGLVPIRREATLEERQSAEVAKGALDVVGELAKRGVGSIAGRAIDGVTQESQRDQEVDRTVVLSVPAGRIITVKVLP